MLPPVTLPTLPVNLWVLGLTGGIGSGKSAAAAHFATLGSAVIDTDVIAHQLTGAEGAAMPALEAVFGRDCRLADGALNRAWMRQRVFNQPAEKQKLEQVLHPLILAQSLQQLNQVTTPYAVLVVPLLFELGHYTPYLSRTLVVDCTEQQQIDRVQQRSGLTIEQVQAIMANQLPRAQRLAAAQDVIDNSKDLPHLLLQVEQKHRYYLALAEQVASRL